LNEKRKGNDLNNKEQNSKSAHQMRSVFIYFDVFVRNQNPKKIVEPRFKSSLGNRYQNK
jgi:hypothetical protein